MRNERHMEFGANEIVSFGSNTPNNLLFERSKPRKREDLSFNEIFSSNKNNNDIEKYISYRNDSTSQIKSETRRPNSVFQLF